VLRAGGKVNVVPAHAEVEIDGRFLPGDGKRFESVLQEVVGPEIDIEIMHTDIAYESPLDDPILQAMSAALRSEIPGAVVVPYLMPGGTDAKHFSPLGVSCYGFLPMLLPLGFDAMSLFHAANERVPVSSLEFGVRTLSRFLVSES
jgi:acetylornithine deacetylase/succinyl-diaminopimelate desuccinylase-like protein